MPFKFQAQPIEVELVTPIGKSEIFACWLFYPEEESPELLAIYRHRDSRWHPASQRLKNYLEPLTHTQAYAGFFLNLEIAAGIGWDEQRIDAESAYGDWCYERQRDKEFWKANASREV